MSPEGPTSIFVKLSVGPRREDGDRGGGWEVPVNLCYTTYIKAKKIKQAFYNYKAQKEK